MPPERTMTRRIAAAILLTVWAVLIAGGLAAYWVTRAVLVGDLDAALNDRAIALAERSAPQGGVPATPPVIAAQERYVIRNEHGQTIESAVGADTPRHLPPPERAGFARLANGQLLRTVTVRHNGPNGPVTVIISGDATQVDRVLRRLALTLSICGLVAGAAAAAVAVGAARAALRPLHDASAVVGGIDERNLDRRIEADSLPPELRPVAERLNEMLGRLQGAFARRRQFLADASHELRTPVAALITTLEVALRRPRDAAELTAALETCLTDARYLKRLVNVLLEHARGEATAASPTRGGPADAGGLLEECADVVAPLAADRGLQFRRTLGPGLGIVAGPHQVRGVVTNLLSNAIEYNKAGGTVELAARREGEWLVVIVRDTGRGIPAEHLPHLFEPFYRVDGVRRPEAASESPHLGLGLFLVDSHVKALGGRCTVESEPGAGTTFTVVLPVSGADEADVAGEPADAAQAPPEAGIPGESDFRGPSTNPALRR